MPDFKRVFSGSPWEKKIAYCRAVQAGNHIFISGTAPVSPDGSTFAPGDAYLQTKKCLQIIEKAIGELGATMRHVVRTRVFVTDISRWQEYGKAHAEFFADHPPASSIIGIDALIASDMLVEIEADAVL